MKTSTLRKGMLVLLMAVTSLSASAQFEKYTSYLNTSLTGMGLSYSKDSKFKMGVQATGGYFVEDGWMIYGRLGYEHQGARGTMKNRNDLQVGVGGRYYIEQNGIYLGVNCKYVHAGKKFNDVMPGVEVGYAFFLNDAVTVEPAIYYDQSFKNHKDYSTIGFKIGVGVYLFKQ